MVFIWINGKQHFCLPYEDKSMGADGRRNCAESQLLTHIFLGLVLNFNLLNALPMKNILTGFILGENSGYTDVSTLILFIVHYLRMGALFVVIEVQSFA